MTVLEQIARMFAAPPESDALEKLRAARRETESVLPDLKNEVAAYRDVARTYNGKGH